MIRLRAVSLALALDPAQLEQVLAPLQDANRSELLRARGAECEADLFDAIVASRSADEAQAVTNEVLWDLDAKLSWGTMLPSVCARISMFGALMAMALLLADDAKFSTELIDVVAFGGGGTLIAMTVGRESTRIATRSRVLVDQAVERLLRKQWPELRFDGCR